MALLYLLSLCRRFTRLNVGSLLPILCSYAEMLSQPTRCCMRFVSYSVVATGRVEADSVAVQVRDNDEIGDEGDEEAKHVNGELGIELVRV